MEKSVRVLHTLQDLLQRRHAASCEDKSQVLPFKSESPTPDLNYLLERLVSTRFAVSGSVDKNGHAQVSKAVGCSTRSWCQSCWVTIRGVMRTFAYVHNLLCPEFSKSSHLFAAACKSL